MFNRQKNAQPQAGQPQMGQQPVPGYNAQQRPATYSTPNPELGQNPNDRVKLLSRLTAGLAAVTIVSAGFGAFSLISTSAQKAELDGSSQNTVVAKSAIKAGTTITADMLEIVKVPAKYRTSDALDKTDNIIGHEASTEIAAGSQVGGSDYIGSDTAAQLSHRVGKDRVAITITTETASGLAGQLTVGDKVNILYYGTELSGDDSGTTSSGAVAKKLVENVKILSLGGKSTDATNDYDSVTLEVTDEDAEKIKAAAKDGVDLALKPTTNENTAAATAAAQNATANGNTNTSSSATQGSTSSTQAVSNNG